MLKISGGKPAAQTTTLRLEGRIVGAWVEELKRIAEPLLKNGCKLALELADVAFVDEPGVSLLSSLKSRGAKLLNATPFVKEQLKSPKVSP